MLIRFSSSKRGIIVISLYYLILHYFTIFLLFLFTFIFSYTGEFDLKQYANRNFTEFNAGKTSRHHIHV